MHAQGSERNLSHHVEESESEPKKKDAATSTDEEIIGNSQEQPCKIIQSPVFNIHIHVPAKNTGTASKMYLPRIQPIIHLHFDELVTKLKNSKVLQGKELNSKYLKSILSQASPKFGNVSFHNKNISINGKHSKKRLNTSTPKRVLRSNKTAVPDVEENNGNLMNESETSEDEDESHKSVCENNTTNVRTNSTEHRETSEKLSTLVNNNGSPIKLKKAIVVLEDICKSKSFKDGSFSNVINQKEIKSQSLWNSSLITNSNLPLKVKMETLPCSSKSDSSDLSNDSNSLSADNVENNCKCTKQCNSLRDINLGGFENENCRNWKTLLSLTEGCNFSELLKRFKSNRMHLGDHRKKANFLDKAKFEMKRERELSHDEDVATEKITHTEEKGPSNIDLVDINEEINLDVGDKRENNDEINLRGRKSVSCVQSCKIETQSSSSEIHGMVQTCTHHLLESKTEVRSPSEYYRGKEQNVPIEKKSIAHTCQCFKNQFDANETNTGDSEITPNNKKVSEVAEDLSLAFKSSNKTSNLVIESDPFLFESDDLISFELEDHDIDLNFSEEDMGKRSRDRKSKAQAKRKHTSVSKSENPSSSKQMKKSHETAKKSPEKEVSKSPVSEEYIPLAVSGGPTCFAVAPLPNVQPYKSHSAKNFKNDMLFGKRVPRFNSSNEYRISKLKNRTRRLLVQ